MDFHFLTGSQRSFIIPSKGQVSRAYTWGANFHGCFPTFLSTLRQVTRSSEGRVNNKVPIKIRGEIGSKEDLLALGKFVVFLSAI